MLLGPLQMLFTQAHKLPWVLSQILPIIAHILSNLGFHKNTHHITTKIGPQNYIIPTQSPTSFDLWAKPKENPKFQKSHYDVANSKFHYNVANSKSPTTMWLIPSPLRCSTIYKARCYMAILYKISKSFLQSPNSYLAFIFTKTKF